MDSRYQRQILLPEIGESGQQRISRARVLIVGVGGLGSPIALYLTCAGIGTIGLVDDDVVSETNLHRQVLYDETQKGLPKVLCAQERLLAHNSTVKFKSFACRLTKENAEDIIKEFDIVVDGSDNFETRYIISDICCKLTKPYVYGAICGLDGQVSVLCKGHASYRTLFPDEQETLSMPHPGKQVIGVTPGIVGNIQALQVLQLICNFGQPLIDRLWSINLQTLDTFIIDI